MYMYICWKSRLWLEFGEYIFYNITMIYGVILWKKRLEEDGKHVEPKKMSKKAIAWSMVATAVTTIGFGLFDKFSLHGAVPFADAFTISLTVIAQILIMLCYREQWIFWLILDIASCITFALIKEFSSKVLPVSSISPLSHPISLKHKILKFKLFSSTIRCKSSNFL